MSDESSAKRVVYVLLAAVLLAPMAYFIRGATVFYIVYFSYDYDDYPRTRHRRMDTDRMEAHGVDGMKNVFAIAGWSGVGIVSLFCVSLLIRKKRCESQ